MENRKEEAVEVRMYELLGTKSLAQILNQEKKKRRSKDSQKYFKYF